jgi:hypothetical protein
MIVFVDWCMRHDVALLYFIIDLQADTYPVLAKYVPASLRKKKPFS